MIIEQNIKIFVFLKHHWSVYIITIILQNGFFIKLFAEHIPQETKQSQMKTF